MDMQVILTQMAILFILMAIGFIVGKAKILTKEANKMLSQIVLFIALPCTIFTSAFENEMPITLGDTLYYMVMVLLTFAIAFLISIPVFYILGGEKVNRGILIVVAVFSNCAYMGFPVINAIFGISSVYYVALFSIPFNVLIFSLGIYLIAQKKAPGDNRTDDPADGNQSRGGFNPKYLLNPVILSILIALPLAIIGVKPPYIVTEVFRITGSITTPGAMLIIGSTLALVPLKSVFAEWRIVPVTLLKLIIIPLVTWLVLRQIISNELMLGVLVVISAMPTAAAASMLAIEYNGNERIASASVFLTTLLCGITVPLIVYLFLM